ncbi:MAG: steroid delta-isomerase [Maricaulis sp.]|nr:steroid delta-isomerase [Maricaulis sp.]
MSASPKAVVRSWVDAFNAADVDALAVLYHADAVNHQVAYAPLEGRENIRRLFETEFARATMVCHVENLFEDGEWAMLEWSDPAGLRGCGFFHVQDGLIRLQRGYFDRLTFYKAQDIALDDIIA